MMNLDETNGALLMVERQLRMVEDQLAELDRKGTFSDKSFQILRETKVDLINLSRKMSDVRGWNYEIQNTSDI